jgi:hypothetical protein
MRSADKAFVEFVRKTIGEYGLKLVLRNSSWLMADGFSCHGWFDIDDEKEIFEIRVATKNPRWIEVLAHEYSHFLQWRKGTHLYRVCFGPTNKYAEVVEDWICGKEYDRRRVKRAFNAYRAMERECELIATKVMQRHGIEYDHERYAQEANCCLYMYHFMERRRIKDFKKDPLSWRMLRKMPSSFRAQSHKVLPKEVSDLLEDCL